MNFNPYLPANHQDIDDIEEDSMMTDAAMMDHLTDYADELGDQALIDLFQAWHLSKMGKPLTPKVKALDTLSNLVNGVSKLEKKHNDIRYQMALTDVLILITKETASL